jgi:hypothetical protein
MMSIAPTFEPFDRERTFYDLDTLQSMLGEAVKDNPHLADQLAWLFYRVLREMAEGREGGERVVNTMKLGVEWLYRYTDTHKLSFQAFLYHLEGLTVPSDTPGEVMMGVIETAEAKATRAYAEDTKAKRAKKRKPDTAGKRPSR